jgi:hypothetical protein
MLRVGIASPTLLDDRQPNISPLSKPKAGAGVGALSVIMSLRAEL